MYQKLLCTLICLLFLILFSAGSIHADDDKKIKGIVGLTENQEATLANQELSRYALMDADCDSEASMYEAYNSSVRAFANAMMPPTLVTECCEVGSGTDDAEEIIGNGAYGDTDSNIGLGSGATNGASGQTIAAFRFDCYNIPQGAKITNAYIQFTNAAPSSRGAAFQIKGEDADNCATFSAGNPPSSRVATSANVSWSPPTWVAAGDALPAQRTPDVSSIIQEIVNRPGYAAGNAFCLSITGKGHRRTYSFDSGQGAPELCIEYEIEEEITTCDGCPNVTLASLDGVPGFPTVDLLNVCSSPDTISLLIYNNGECDLSNVQLKLTLDAGLTYGDCVMEHYGGPVTADEFDVSNPKEPIFFISRIDSAQAFIIDICVKTDCDVDIKSEDPLNFDANLVFSYPDAGGMDEMCDLELTEIGEFNGGVRIPVLNVLSISPQEVSIPNTTSEVCQTLTISQDGIQASLSQYTFDICGLDLVSYQLGTIRANGTVIDPSLITTDVGAGTATINITGSMFNDNTGAGANNDDIFNVDERMTISVCYSAIGCTDEVMTPEYKIYYGCAEKICFGITSALGAVKFQPNFGANAVANTSNIEYGSICGDDLSYEVEVFSSNTDPLDGLWQDLIFKYGACLGNGLSISSLEINDEPLDPSLYTVSGSTLTLDFTSNTDPAYGFTDEDQDGFMDDLQGGQSIRIKTNISIGCSDAMATCSGDLACSLRRIEVQGKRNCGQAFQQFANLSEPVSFFYGNEGSSTNAVPTPGYGIPITEVMVTTCDVWLPGMNGYEFHYDFGSENIGSCGMSGGIKLVATVTAAGNRIKHIRFEDGSATYQGAAVPGAIGYPNTIDIGGGILDTVSYTVEVPAGDGSVTAHDYYFNLEFEGFCSPNDYAFVSFKVVEECMSCTEVTPCEIVRACDSAATYVRWNGCGCVCDIRASVDTIQRTNFGYADKAMTQKLTAADVPTEDLQRFLPGDTMYTRLKYEVLNASVYYEGDYAWLFDVRYRGWDNPLMPDIYNIQFEGWYHEDVSAGTGPLEIGVPDCMLNYDDGNIDNQTFPSMRLTNMGVEGSLGDGGECPDDDINPDYPADQVDYRIADLSIHDDYNDLSRMWMFFGRDEGCASATPDELNNTCHQDLLAQLDLEDGDIFYIDLMIPMVRNPNVSLAEMNGITPNPIGYLFPYADARMATVGTCGSSVTSRTCRTTGPYEGHLPGPISISQDVCVTDCDTEVEYTFTLTNPLPEVDAGVTPWYENEFRPFMATEYLEVSFPSNMVYLDNGVIVMPDGSEVSFSDFIDTNEGNLNCITGPGGEQCCIAADPSQLAMMKIIDNDYTIGQSQPYYRGPITANNTGDFCDVNQLLHVPNDPFPHIPVGGGEVCTYGIKYSLSALCPEDIESGDFQLSYQFSDPYVPSLPGSSGAYNSTYLRSGNIYTGSNGFRYPINPYGTQCNTNPAPWGCVRYYEGIVSNPDDSPGSINPMRQTGTIVTGPDNFADKSLNYPPLAAVMEKTLIADDAMVNEENTYTVCADNNGIDMGTHMNVVTTLEIPTTIDLIGICDEADTPLTFNLVQAGTNTNLYSVLNPDLAPGECFEIKIKTELLFCPVGLPDVDVEICVTTVSGCIDPAKAALFTALGETQCDAAGACYEYIAEEAEMQGEWSSDATGEYPLCETFDLAVRIKNVRPTILTDIEPEWYFPAGITFVPNSWRVCFPGGPANNGASTPIPDPIADPNKNNIYGTYFEFLDDGDWNTYIDQNGLPGVAAMLDSNKVEFKFEVETDCNTFVSGTSIWFRADGADPCEMRTGSGFVPTSPIIIDGANPSDFAQFFVFADPLDATCGEASTITMNFLNISPTGVTDNSMVCMDIDTETFSYMMGSIQWVTPAGHMPTFTEEQNGAITHVCFDIPDGIGPGQAFQVSFMFEVPEDVGCGEQDLGVNVSSTVMNANCDAQGIVCDVQVLNSVNPAIQVDFNPPVEVSDQVLTVGCGNGDGTVPLCYDIELANNSTDYDDFIKIKLIRDLNQNGILEDFDPPLDSISVNVMVLAGDTSNIMGCFNVDENIACPVFLMVMQETNCICDAQDFYYDSIEPEASDELGLSIAVCPGEPLKVGFCADLEYTVTPSGGATIAPNAAGDSLCITLEPGFGLSSPVVLGVSSQTGGCMMFDFETEIFSLGDFEFGPYEDETACNVGCIDLDLDLPTEYRDIVTVLWEPSTYLDDPTSQTPIACEVQMDITYMVTVNFMENGQMCEFMAEVPIIVEEQQTNPLFEQVILCSESTSTVVGPPGFSNYNWYEVTPAGDSPIQSGNSDTFIVPSAGTYYLEYYNITDACKTLSAPFDAIACPTLIKSFVDAVPTANENEYTVCYEIAVDNNSDLDTEYDLFDRPDFDDDITIISASYTSTAGPSGTLGVPAPASPGWLLGNDVQLVGLGGHTYDVCLIVQIDLEDGVTGDDSYTTCGANGGGGPGIGEGLFNEASLDVDEDGMPDSTDDACGELPFYTIEKTISSLTQTGAYDYTVTYDIVVCNDGGAIGTYDLNDVPSYDDDIIINGAQFTTDAFEHPSNPGPTTLTGNGPWDLADLQDIEPAECQTYTVSVDVTMNLEDGATPGDGNYTSCGENGGTDPMPGEGLYNEAQLDTNGDGMPNQSDDECADLPSITHDKSLTSITQTGARSWEAKYTITVENNGGASGMYDLEDEIAFDDDIVVTCVRYTSDATANANNPGPTIDADLAGPWTLADDQNIDAGVTQTYCIIFCVDMDLNSASTPGDGDYDACGDGGGADGEAGEGLYNQSQLDLDNDGTPEESEEACGDLPNVYHEKEVISFVPMANGNHMITYEICVYNNGGADGNYNLTDEPQFDDDIAIVNATYNCDIGGAGSTLPLPVPTGGWLLLEDQDISPDNTHCCTIDIEVDIDTSPLSGGDNMVTECGTAVPGDPSPGEALYNESGLDLDDDGTPDEVDEACEDVFDLTHDKTISNIMETGHNTFCVTYNIAVDNNGTAPGFYDLSDLPQYDQDITIITANYSSSIHPNTPLAASPPATGWILGDDELIPAGVSHIYELVVCVEINLEDDGAVDAGDDIYQACGDGGAGADGMPGQGLYNQSFLDTNNDGTPDETDEVCGDLPYLTLNKESVSVTQIGARDFDVVYQITVCNIGGAAGEYNLLDTPCFDDDVVINSANYSSDAAGNGGNPGPINLSGMGPWTMASDQAITEGTCQVYDLTVNVTMDLTDPATPGDGVYASCAAGDPNDPSSTGGLYNKSSVDTDGDGTPDIQDEACEELPAITHVKELATITQTGPNSWDVVYTITVSNDGGAAGTYDLNDDTSYDDDIAITCANYTSDAAGNAGNPGPFDLGVVDPWTLADDQSIDAGTQQVYTLTVCVDMDLNSPTTPGDGDYAACGDGGAGADGMPGEGLYNVSTLDLDNDGTADEDDEACGDLPHLFHEKSVSSFAAMANGNNMVTYEICVTNDGGADGMYDLYDEPQFDDDIEIVGATTTCDIGGANTYTVPVPAGGWLIQDDVTIAAGVTNCCTIEIEVNIDLAPGSGGDDIVTECGTAVPGDPSPGEALYNESSLDVNNDGTPDETDEACEDIFAISHDKAIASVVETGHNQFCVTYNIEVVNNGEEPGFYDLTDLPQFDDDITILSATYTSTVHPNINLPITPPATGWILGDDESIASNVTHVYELVVCVEIDLEDGVVGDDTYTACGAGGTGINGAAGQGLYNQSFLDTNDDGTPDEDDEVCADLPYLTINKDVISVTQTGPRDYDVVYAITVCNIGGATGDYNMSDQPCFDNDIVINSATYTSDAAGNLGTPGPRGLSGTGPWTMATNQDINASACQVYNLTVNVTMDLTDPATPGDGVYASCAAGDPNDPSSTGGLYNKSSVDTDGDGTPDIQDEACEELPAITHVKELATITQTGPNSWDVVYTITVSNDGGAAGTYDLNDDTSYDDDIAITCANYTSDAAGNAGNPGPFDLGVVDPWTLADDQSIDAGTQQVYTLTVCVDMDLNSPTTPGDGDYAACGDGGAGADGMPGEGLYNVSTLDLDNDGTADEDDEACGDLPHLFHEKSVSSFAAMANGNNMVTYEICVTNDGGADGMYDLYDEPQFDDDIEIVGATTTCDIGGANTYTVPVPAGGWLIQDDVTIAAGVTYCCTIEIEVNIDLAPGSGGDDIVTECGTAVPGDPSPGEALFNESSLDVNNDGIPDEVDEACEDVFEFTHEKTLTSIVQQADGSYCATYQIEVTNGGNEDGFYDLYDLPQFDTDFTILSASYSSTVHPTLPLALPVPSGLGWLIGNDELLNSGQTHLYEVVICVDLDLEDGGAADGGDDIYTACGDGGAGPDGMMGEGLYNESSLDTNDDGVADQMDEACGDVPYFTIEKEIVGVTQTGARSWTVEYTIDVCNIGGATGIYDLTDTPGFDDDVVVDGARYTADTPSNPGNPGPTTLSGTGPWTLADDASLAEGGCHAYTLFVDVSMDLTDANSPGDESYSECGSGGNGADGSPGEGLYNTASLDTNNDGIQDVEDDACGDLPAISHEKNLTSITQTGARSFEVKYTITVENEGGAEGAYDLNDEVFFDDDIVTTCARYTSDAAGNPANPTEVTLAISGLWNLADDQSIAANTIHTYCLIVCVDMDLNSLTTPGDGNYDACGSNSLNDPQRGEGLYNESYLDLDNDGMNDEEDEACGDLPYVYHEKNVVSFVPMPNGNNMVTYEICVYNSGGADGEFDLYDEPIFDDDIEIVAATYSCDVQGGGALAIPVPATPGWQLIDDQDISPNTSYCCTIDIEVDVDLSAGSTGDNVVSECGSTNGNGDSEPGEALHNESSLDVNNDGTIDEVDEACRDIFMITHEKTIARVVHNPDDSYCVTWNILVQNMSTESGFYDLYDWPQFDEDFIMLSANYSSSVHPFTNLTPPPPAGGWQFADDINIAANGRHIYTLEICMIMDLKDENTPGDADYTSCGEMSGGGAGEPGEGLFNQTLLDINNDGTADEIDDVCIDIPYVTHEKDFVDAVRNADGTYTATFKITVQNIGGATGDYDLWDQPAFDNDFVINSAEYTTDATGHSANPGPEALATSGQWDLADDQTIDAGETQCYNLSVNVTINLSDPDTEGDEIYTFCGTANGADNPEPGEGFYNESFLDRSNDGDPEENEETCGDVDIVDLAIKKETVTPPTYAYGQVIEFKHTIYNQGNVDMYNIELADYLPAGFGFAGVAGNDASWTQTSPTLIEYASIPGPIVPRDSAVVTLFLEILPTTGGNEDWWNYSEITYMEDEDGEDRSDEDVDSNIDDDPDNDNQPDLGGDDDDEITEGGPDAGEDEDDHDVAGIEIFDLAQRKTTTATAPLGYGDIVPFTIEVFNQGSETATDIVVLDHIPCGYSYNASNDAAGWAYDGTGIASITIAGPLEPGLSTSVVINLTLQQCLDMDEASFTNIAEITDGDGEDGEPGDDIDSDPDGDPDNDGDPNDDSVDDPNDEDDHDPEEVQIWDLALIKQIVTAEPYAYGDLLEFKITVCNQGNQTVQNINVIDYLPVGYSFDAADQTTPWTVIGAGPDVEYTIAGPLLEDTCVEIPLFLTLEMTTGGVGNYTNVSEITDFEDENGDPQEDADSDPDNDPDNDGDPTDDSLDDPNDEDDHDPEMIEVFDLAQKKTTTAMGPFSYGDVIPFDITVYNQGNIGATNILINEHLPCGFIYTADNDANGWVYDAATGIANATIAGPLTPGDSTTITINVTLQQCIDMDKSSFTNISEIGGADDEEGDPRDDIDSDGDDDPDNDGDPNDDEVNDPDDEDDHDPEEIVIYDLALIKQIVTAGPYAYGDLLEFKITVCNQGNQTVQNINVIDYLPVGYSFNPADQTTPWTVIGAGPDVEYTIAGPLLEDTCIELPLFLTLEMTEGGAGNYTNVSEITDFEDENGDPQEDADSDPDNDPDNDGDSTDDSLDDPNDEDDHDPEIIEVFDLAQKKTTTEVGPFSYGDVIPFDITVYNQGNIGATNILINEHLPCGFIYTADNDANGWVYNAATGIANATIAGPLTPGDSTVVTINVTLQQCLDMDDGSFTNISEIGSADDEDGDPRDDIDSDGDDDPDNDGEPNDDEVNDPDDEDDHDPEEIAIYDLAQIKQIVTPTPYAYGDLLEFKITVCNQGNQTVQNINVIDYLPAGYNFDPADQTTPWTVVGAGPNVEFTIEGPLSEDTCMELPLFLTLVESGGGADDFTNISEITDFEDENGDPQEDADSNPDNDPDNDGDSTDDSLDDPNDEDDHDPEVIEIIDIAMKKVEISSGPYKYGDQLNFSHWIYNQGNVGLTNIKLNDFIPCGYDYDTNNNPIWSYDATSSTATTTVSNLINPGDSLEVKFSLILKACTDPDAWKNISEIESFDDENGDDRTDDDIDSDGDDDPDNDGDVVDDEIDNGGGDEDDNDPAEPEIFDLALIKTIDNIGPYTPGQIAMYDITVFNQGNVPAYNVEIVDYVNVGYIFNAADNPGWTLTGDKAYYTIPGPLVPGDQIIVAINLEVQVPAGADLSSWYNEAEINDGENEEGTQQFDVDSDPDDDAFNDNDLVDGLDPDNIFDEDDLNDNEINNNNGDEDDNDAAEILVTGEIGDFVWKDLNGDGIQDPGEPGIEGVTVRLFDCDGNFIRELTTDANGYYLFDLLLPGGYQVQFDISDLPPGCAFTLPNAGGDDAADSDTDLDGNTPCIDLEAGERNHTIDAGVLPLAKLGDTVWEDCNGDGILNNGEQGIAGIRVEVYGADNVLVKMTTTDSNGKYIVDGLYPGDYYVKFVIGDYEFTMSGIGGDSTEDSDVDDSNGPGTTTLVNLSAGECDISSFDAGLYKCVRIGELVWLDYNENDVWDSFENGINGLKVELYKFIDGSWNYYDYTYTGHKPGTPSDDGYFKFCVAPGRYYLKFLNPPATLVPAVSNFGINESVDSDVTGAFGPGTTSEIVLACGQERCDIGAGYYKMGSIGDNVWMDTNNNGMRETSEQGIKDVIVRAYDNTGSMLGEATTDNNGEYMIDYLGKNSYYLEFDLPNGLALTTPNMGSDDSMDSDVDGSNGPMTTDYYTISPGEHVPNVDAGVVFGVLSVEWLDVRAENNDSHHTVTWDVAKETNVSHYEVERSLNGLDDFEVIGKILSEGDSPQQRTYSYDDYNVADSGIYYYRVNQVELDGVMDYSKVVSVDRDAVLLADNIATIYPNPVVNELTLDLVITKPVEDLIINIFDAQGRIARKNAIMDIDVSEGAKTYRVDVRDFSKGVYSMKIMLDRKEIVKKLIIVE